MSSHYHRDHRAARNDEFLRLNTEGRAVIRNAAAFYEGQAMEGLTDDKEPSEGERLALRRAMARFMIDSGIASARGFV